MPASTIGTQLGIGYAGVITRNAPPALIESKPVYSASENIGFGKAVMLRTDDTYAAVDSGFTAAKFAGVAHAAVKQSPSYPTSTGNTEWYYQPEELCNVIKEGVMAVKVQRGTSITSGGAVYVRIQASTETPGLELGGFETSADGSQTVLLTNANWYSNRIDADGVAELKIRFANN